jgi:DNA sulfur modification protein DndD
MIFEEIIINNLFSYYGKNVFDLRSPQPGKNIVLISGRNGFGKTSFITAVKLLFGGATKSICQTVQVGRTLKEKDYLLGTGSEWLGVVNLRARAESKDFGVSIRWREENGTVTVDRSWHLEGHKYSQDLCVRATFLQKPLTEDEAQKFLEQRLPEDYIHYFFFDGEQIQTLAEANRAAQLQHMERILNISRVDTLIEYLGKVIGRWSRTAMDAEARQELIKLEGELNGTRAEQIANRQSQDDLRYAIEDLERRIDEGERYLDSLRAYSLQKDESFLQEKRDSLRQDLERQQLEFANEFLTEIPLLANEKMVGKVRKELRKLVDEQSAAPDDLQNYLSNGLPKDLFEAPPYPDPPLLKTQELFLKRKLTELLEKYLSNRREGNKSLLRLPAASAKALAQLFDVVAESEQLRRHCTQSLKAIRSAKLQLEEAAQRYHDVSRLGEEERQEYRKRKSRIEEMRNEIIERKVNLKKLEADERSMSSRIGKIEYQIKTQQGTLHQNMQSREKIDLARKLRDFFQKFKDDLKAKYRKDIEEAVNRNFRRIVTSHRMVHRIRIENDFSLHYENVHGEIIGWANLSSGISQLAVTALLWALKDVSGKAIPVIIDTPLARIDREHQENLLTLYYPHAGEQVIILPTDSELDKEKYLRILPYVYREYRLSNPDGQNTDVIPGPMYSFSNEALNGQDLYF